MEHRTKHRRNLATPEPETTTSDLALALKKQPKHAAAGYPHPKSTTNSSSKNFYLPTTLSRHKVDTHSQAKALNVSAEFDSARLSSLARQQHQQLQSKQLKRGNTQEMGKSGGKGGKEEIEEKLKKKFEEWEDGKKPKGREKEKAVEKVRALVVKEGLRKSCDGEVGGVRRNTTSSIVVGGGGGGRRRSFSGVQVELSDVFASYGVRVASVDMPPFMQIHAVDCARKTSDSMEKFACKTLALALKKEFDGVYGPAWHCIVGTSFGSFVTHSVGGFIYFAMDQKTYILLFKTTVQRAD